YEYDVLEEYVYLYNSVSFAQCELATFYQCLSPNFLTVNWMDANSEPHSVFTLDLDDANIVPGDVRKDFGAGSVTAPFKRFAVVPSSIVERDYKELGPAAIGHVAALFQLFWDETHAPVPVIN